MITTVSAKTASSVMDVLQQRCQWASLHHEIPDFSAPAATELQFGGYGRQQIGWERSSGGWYMHNLQALTWHGLVFPSKVMAVGLWNFPFGGELEAYGTLAKVSRVTGSTWTLASGMLVLRIGSGA